jgi:hypothetical protein
VLTSPAHHRSDCALPAKAEPADQWNVFEQLEVDLSRCVHPLSSCGTGSKLIWRNQNPYRCALKSAKFEGYHEIDEVIRFYQRAAVPNDDYAIKVKSMASKS